MQALHYLGKAQLRWQDIPDAALVETSDAIVRPLAVAACDLDRSIFEGLAPFKPPFVIGHEFAGEVMARGEHVTAVDVGDIVLASFQPSCGACVNCQRGYSAACTEVPPTSMYGIGEAAGEWSGALADAVRVPWANFNLRRLPNGVTPLAAASASDNFADGLRAVDQELAARPRSSVLIAGTGSIPLYTIAAARHLGAGRITYASDNKRALVNPNDARFPEYSAEVEAYLLANNLIAPSDRAADAPTNQACAHETPQGAPMFFQR